MTQPKYHSLFELVSLIDEPNQVAILRFINANRAVLQEACGSSHNHQAWKGGWWDHITEVMNIAVVLYPVLNALRPLPFTLSDALLVLFMHDIEKPWKYEENDGVRVHRTGMETKAKHQQFRMQVAGSWDITLADEHVNGIKYAEGELDDYTPRHRVMGLLASFVHMCDVSSACLWPNHPLAEDDPWQSARRIAYTPEPVRDARPAVSEAVQSARRTEKPPGDCGVGCGCGFCN